MAEFILEGMMAEMRWVYGGMGVHRGQNRGISLW